MISQGIIHDLKSSYRRFFLSKWIDSIDDGKCKFYVSILDAINSLYTACEKTFRFCLEEHVTLAWHFIHTSWNSRMLCVWESGWNLLFSLTKCHKLGFTILRELCHSKMQRTELTIDHRHQIHKLKILCSGSQEWVITRCFLGEEKSAFWERTSSA